MHLIPLVLGNDKHQSCGRKGSKGEFNAMFGSCGEVNHTKTQNLQLSILQIYFRQNSPSFICQQVKYLHVTKQILGDS